MAKTTQMRGRITGRLAGKSGAWMTRKTMVGSELSRMYVSLLARLTRSRRLPRGLDAEVFPADQQKRP